MKKTYKGGCHCGKVRYEAQAEITEVIECNCSICRRNGYLLWFVPRDNVSLKMSEDIMSTYTFNRHVIKHRFCPTCGASVFGMAKNKDGADMVAVNMLETPGPVVAVHTARRPVSR